jgi:MraZ protein
MFLGEYAYALDKKGRLTIPVRFRAGLAAGLVMTRGYEPCLRIYPHDTWAALAAKVAQIPSTDQAARAYSRLIFGGAFEATPDKLGRVLVPSVLRGYAGIDSEAVIVGVNACVEVWNPLRWQETLARDTLDLDAILAGVARMGV